MVGGFNGSDMGIPPCAASRWTTDTRRKVRRLSGDGSVMGTALGAIRRQFTTFCGWPERKARTFAAAVFSRRARGDDAGAGGKQRIAGGRGLGGEDVVAGACNPTCIERLGMGRLIDEGPRLF